MLLSIIKYHDKFQCSWPNRLRDNNCLVENNGWLGGKHSGFGHNVLLNFLSRSVVLNHIVEYWRVIVKLPV